MNYSNQAQAVEPWRELPAELADLLEPELPALTAEILATIPREVPEYARPFEGSFGRGIKVGVTEALHRFLELIRAPDVRPEPGREVYVELGRGELRQGRSLDSLQAAYRIGARVAWRRLAAAGRSGGVADEVLHRLAEAIFAYIEELSSESVEGYAQEQSLREGVRERERRRLLAVLTSDSPAPEELREAAAGSGWTVPATVAALACDSEDLPAVSRRLPTDCLGSAVRGIGCIAVPDPEGPGRRQRIIAAAEGRGAALGPTVPPDRFARSWEEAAAARRALGGDRLIAAEERLFDLILAESRSRLRRIAARRLAPLGPLTPKARERMIDTLAAYLGTLGDVSAAAAALHVHPQTVRYRLSRLAELLGDQLEDPDARLELHAALRAGCLAPAPADHRDES
jgi:hypothetical protein